MPHTATPQNPDRDSAVRILIVRVSAIGDVLMTSPVAQALKEHYPNAHVAWAVEPLSAPFVRANPYVDEVIVLERMPEWEKLLSRWQLLSLWRELCRFKRELQARKFDIVIDFQGLLKSGLLTRFSGAPRRIGQRPCWEYNHLFMTEQVYRPRSITRITQGYLAMLSALGISAEARKPVLEVPEGERTAADDFLAKAGLGEARYVACCVSTSRPQKDWVWLRWRELAEALWERAGLRTVFIGGPERRVDSLRLVEGCRAHPISAVGYTSLLASAAIIQDAAVVVGGDTGLTYAGFATETPTVALYGSTDPVWLAEEPGVTVLFHPMPCAPCRRRPTCKDYDCMQAITVDEVAEAVSALLTRPVTP